MLQDFRQGGECITIIVISLSAQARTYTRESGACPPNKILNFTTSEAASGDSSPHTHFGLLVHKYKKQLNKIEG